MQLANALVIFVTAAYIKLFLLLAPLLSLWNYHNTSRHAYVLLSELILELLLAAILLASLTLTKIDCARIANFLTLPLFLGATYLNWAHQQRALRSASLASSGREIGSEETPSGSSRAPLEEPNDRRPEAINDSWASYSPADSIELALTNCLAGLACVHLSANLFGRQLAGVLS